MAGRKKNNTKRPMSTEDDDFVAVFAESVAREIDKYPSIPSKDEEALVARQKQQVEALVAAEVEARKALIRDPRGIEVYTKFVEFIATERRNSLAAQPYFREPESVFTAEIGPALKSKAVRSLFKFHWNWSFAHFARTAVEWAPSDEFWVATEKIAAARTELVEMNLPLAISRARMFYQRTPKSHLEYLDLIQCAAEGLMMGIDKFRLPYSPVFRSVAINRMVGNFIDRYSETMVRFFPLEKRRIYRANKVMRRFTTDTVDIPSLTAVVNEGMPDRHKATPEQMSLLMSAVSCLSLDWQDKMPEGDDGMSFGESISAPHEHRPDAMYEQAETFALLHTAMADLSMIERKVIRMAFGADFFGG